jgi:AcrR family transcriptional regulator
MSYLRAPERQRQILDCAKQVFAVRGYHAASVSHICEAAGIGRGTLYLYFQNKRAVLIAILEEILGRVRSLMSSRPQPRIPPEVAATLTREQIVRYSERGMAEVLDVVFCDEATLRIVLREAVGLDVDIEQLLARVDDALIGIVERDLLAARESGLVREGLDLRQVATLIVGGVEKLALAALRGESRVDVPSLVRTAVSFHLYGTLEQGG